MSAVPISHHNSGVVARVAYSPAEFAEALGVSRQHVHNMIARGELHSLKLGKARRIPVSEIARLLCCDAKNTQVATSERMDGVA